MKFKRFIYLLFAILLLGCSSELDIKQAEGFTLDPVYKADFFYATIPIIQFFNNQNQQVAIQDEVVTDLFDQDYFSENVKRVDFYFQITNPTSEAFFLELNYYNAENELTNVLEMSIPPASETVGSTISEHIFSITNEELEALKTSVKINYHIEAQTTIIDPSAEESIDIQSKAHIYVHLNT